MVSSPVFDLLGAVEPACGVLVHAQAYSLICHGQRAKRAYTLQWSRLTARSPVLGRLARAAYAYVTDQPQIGWFSSSNKNGRLKIM